MEAIVAYLKRPLTPFVIALIVIIIITVAIVYTHHAHEKSSAPEAFRSEIPVPQILLLQRDSPSEESKQP